MLIVLSRIEKYNELINRVIEYTTLPDGWGGHDTDKAPSDLVINQAHLWLHLCSEYTDIPPPHVTCSTDNEICLEWKPDGEYKSYCRIFIKNDSIYGMFVDYQNNKYFSQLPWFHATTRKEQFKQMSVLLLRNINNLEPKKETLRYDGLY